MADDAIVAFRAVAVFLLALDDSDDAALQDAAGKRGLIHQHENIDGITVVGLGRGNDPKSYGNAMPVGRTVLSWKISRFESNLYLLRLP